VLVSLLVGVLAGFAPPTFRLPILSGSGQGAGGANTSVTRSLAPALCNPFDTPCLLQQVAASAATAIGSALQPLSDAILKSPADLIYQTPLLTNDNEALNHAILSLNTFFIEVVDIAFAAFLLIGGYNVIVGRHLLLPFSTIMEILPRAVLVMLAVHFNVFFLSLFVNLENTLSLAVIHLAGFQMLTNLIAGLLTFQNVSLLSFVLIVVLAIMAVLLLLQMIVRLALVAIGLALAPLGLGCFFLPQTVRWGRLWITILSTSLMVQFIQVVALGLGGIFITALANTSLLRLDKDLAIALLAIGTLGLVLKIPGMLQTWALHPMMSASDNKGGSGAQSDTTSATTGGSSESGGSGSAATDAGASGGSIVEGTIMADESGALFLMI
ncbi:MAG TPA: hypothetical protein VFN35_34375, partial [Ktedonobacteraceae bacterium]|nr:hypothetical protein [Ktedonobacteraceae bacterium]